MNDPTPDDLESFLLWAEERQRNRDEDAAEAMWAATTEIERLQEQRSDLARQTALKTGELDRQGAKIVQLQTALEAIRDAPVGLSPTYLRNIAREALANDR